MFENHTFWKFWTGRVSTILTDNVENNGKGGVQKITLNAMESETMGVHDGEKTGNQHLGIPIKSLRSCIILDDLDISINPSKSNISLKTWDAFWIMLGKIR